MESLFNSLSSFSYLSLTIAVKSLFVGTIFFVLIFASQKYFKRSHSSFRYVTLWSILIAMLIIPIISTTISINFIENSLTDFNQQENQSSQILVSNSKNKSLDNTNTYKNDTKNRQVGYIPNSNKNSFVPATQINQESESYWMTVLRLTPVVFSLVWFVITILLLYRVCKSYDKILRIKHSAKQIDNKGYSFVEKALSQFKLSRPVRIGTSDKISIPIAAGFKYPMILLPTSIIHELTNKELEIIIMHELTHLKRWDDFSKLGQRIVEAFGFFNPAIKWIGNQLELEREVACDEFVIDRIGSTSKYAECLTRLMQITQGTGTTLIPGFYSSKRQIFRRFEEMFMNEKKKRTAFSRYMFVSVISLMLLFSFTIIQVTPVFAFSGSYLTFQEVNDLFNKIKLDELNNKTDGINDVVDDFADVSADMQFAGTFSNNFNKLSNETENPDISLIVDGTIDTRGESNTNINKRSRKNLISRLADKTEDLFSNIKGTAISRDDDGETTLFWSNGRNEFRVKYYGEIEFTDDDKWIKSLEKDGYFSIFEKHGRNTKEFDLEIDKNGEFDILYYVNGDKKDFDEDGKEWVSEILEEVYLKVGFNADKRVAKMYAEGGTDAVLDYMYKVESDYVYRLYISELLLQDELSEKDYSRILELVEVNIDSDYEKAELLISISKTIQNNEKLIADYVSAVKSIDSDYETRRVLSELSFSSKTDPKIILAVLEIAQDIDSDYEKAELLIDLSKVCRNNPELNDEYIKAMKNLDSDYETRRVFSAIGRKADLTDESLNELILLADNIDSDYEKAEYLIELSDMVENDDDKQLALIATTRTIDSDYEIRRVLDHYDYSCNKDSKLLLAKLEIITKMDSDYEKVESLIEHSECAAENGEIRELYLNSLKNVDSDYEKSRALSELIVHADLDGNNEFIINIIELASTMDSDYEKGEILSELADYCRDNEELEELYLNAIDDMSSEYEIQKLYERLNKKYKSSKRKNSSQYY